MEKIIIGIGIAITLLGVILQFRASKKENSSTTQQVVESNQYEKLDKSKELVLAIDEDSWDDDESVENTEQTNDDWGNDELVESIEQTNFETHHQEPSTLKANESQIIDLINLAIADGIVTPNEKKLILDKAKELGKDISEVEQQLADVLAQINTEAETRLINKNKEKGNDFEGYVADKFKLQDKYFKLLEWAGDKVSSNGNYAETTTHPDLKLHFSHKDEEQVFSVECKYRSSYYHDKIIWAKKYQIERYKKFEKEKGIPVFIVLGVGGTADNPEELFIIPLKSANYTSFKKEYLVKFKKKNSKFFFDAKKMKLS